MLGQLTTAAIEELLQTCTIGRIGCHHEGITYVVPVSYIYDGTAIIAHSVEGMKVNMMRQNPAVCFEVDEMVSPTNWKSVIAWGSFHELTDERERYDAMKQFVDRMMKLKISTTAHPPETSAERQHPSGSAKPVIYKIILREKTGRYETDHV